MYIYINRLHWTKSGSLQIDSIELKNYRGKLNLIETRKKHFCVFTKIFCWSDCWEEEKTAPDRAIFKLFFVKNEKILKWIFSLLSMRRKPSCDRRSRIQFSRRHTTRRRLKTRFRAKENSLKINTLCSNRHLEFE